MPFYEYQCGSCNQHVEVLQKISDAPLRKCPNCGKQKLKRILSAPVFRLKGSGWYETDFKSDGESKRNLAEHPNKDAKASDAVDATAKPAETKPAEPKETPKVAEAKPAPPSRGRAAAKAAKPKPATKPRPKSASPKRKAARR